MNTQIVIGILIPFVGTSLGAAMVFFLKNSVSKKLQRILTGFAAGVMVAASFWSLCSRLWKVLRAWVSSRLFLRLLVSLSV